MKYFLFTGTTTADMYFRFASHRRDAVAEFDTALALKQYMDQNIPSYTYIDPKKYIAIGVDFQSNKIKNIKLIYNKEPEVPNLLYIDGVFSDTDEPGENNPWVVKSQGVSELYKDFLDAIVEFDEREIEYGDVAAFDNVQLLYHDIVIADNQVLAESRKPLIPRKI